MDVLARLEAIESDSKDRPIQNIELKDVIVFVDPFEEFQNERQENEQREKRDEEIKRAGGTEDDRTTWTGKRLRADGKSAGDASESVGKYLQAALQQEPNKDGNSPDMQEEVVYEEPVKKKARTGGFGGFDGW
jgi:peptidyl-prolyl cis-trans isomerase-like protein 2